jgi:hypothetical protein
MTQKNSFSIILTMIALMISTHGSAVIQVKVTSHHELSVADNFNVSAMTTPVEPENHDLPIPVLPAAHAPKGQGHKSEAKHLEELAHIHHFHKERVKKLKRHHKKVWAMSKFIIILCHLLLLIVAYMHVAH